MSDDHADAGNAVTAEPLPGLGPEADAPDWLAATGKVGANCRSCGAPTVWTMTMTKKTMLVDAVPSAKGNLLLRVGTNGTVYSAVNGTDPRGDGWHGLFLSHFATCRYAADYRRKDDKR